MSHKKGSRKKNPLTLINTTHGTSLSTLSSYDKSTLSPNLRSNSLQRRSAINTDYGKSPVSFSADDTVLKFDYNIFVTTWQDQIKMRQYVNCEKYCREVIDKLLAAEDQQVLMAGFGGILSKTKSAPSKPQYAQSKTQSAPINHHNNDDLHTLLEYRSKVHFSLAYLLKKYFKRYDEAREQYQQSIKTDRENPGAHFNLANMLVDHYHDYETAQYHFEKAIALEPSYSLYRMTFAEFLWHDCKRYKESAAQYEELITNNTHENNEDIFFNYGLLLRDHLKNIPQALKQFKMVIQLNPNDKEAQEEYNYTLSLNKMNEKAEDEKENDDKVVFNEMNLNKMDLSQLIENSQKSEETKDNCEVIVNPNQKRLEYQKNRKKHAFRRSQHEINLNSVNEDENYALKYHQVVDEKNKLNVILKQKQSQVNKQNVNLLKIKEIWSGSRNFKKELHLMVQNGANYVEVNAKNAHKLLSICNEIMIQLEAMEITKDNDGNVTPLVEAHYNGRKRDPSIV